ncbi:MAG TPA: hypothetical protein VFX91_00430, partial [Alcanivorax sp.]|nr:hypothetical protein [Alcanivorax sp.]
SKDVFMKEIEPLARQLQEKCKEHRLPVLCAVCYANDGERTTILSMAHFCGKERTPRAFLSANHCIENPNMAAHLESLAALLKEEEQPTE